MAKRDYLVDAAKQIRLALDREVSEDYEAAFNYYKNGVDLLLNGVQVDPNKERREAVKRKTTQYLKRAEEIFTSYLQDSVGKDTSQFRGYSSLRFRPIRNLSSPVEDLGMCKVIGIIDKVLIVQSLINKETFVVKSLPKSSGVSRDHPTIIPQGVPFMMKLLRYYVSEDAVYLHLEHVTGGRLFSKLHKVRTAAVREHPECLSPNQRKFQMKNSYTTPAISHECLQNGKGNSRMAITLERESPESPVMDSFVSWNEAQHQLENCRTHSYCEETGCLQNSRLEGSNIQAQDCTFSFTVNTDDVHSFTKPANGLSPQPCSQENIPLPIHPCVLVDTRDSLSVTSDLLGNDVRIERINSSLDFDMALNVAGLAQDCGNLTLAGSSSQVQEGDSIPQITPSSLHGTLSQTSGSNTVSIHSQRIHIVSDTLQFPLQNQSQDRKEPAHTSNWQTGDTTGTGLPLNAASELIPSWQRLENSSTKLETMEKPERTQILTELCSGNSQPYPSLKKSQHPKEEGISLDFKGMTLKERSASRNAVKEIRKEFEDESWEMLGPLGKGPEGDSLSPNGKASRQDESGSQQPDLEPLIEIDGWCHLPQFKAKRRSTRSKQGRWGLPEDQVRLWGAQVLLALESLHEQGIVCQDLNPKNILLNSNGKVCLTYFGQWSEVQREISPKAMEQMYCAPEIGGVAKITEACDWWSLGALLFELLTGMPLWQCHPTGVHPHTQLLIPDHLSTAAASLLTELLQFDAGYRLGSGGGGVSDIKCHPFFNSVPWHTLGS